MTFVENWYIIHHIFSERGVTLNTNMLISDDMSLTIIDTVEKLAIELGAENVTVRQVLRALDITNRVFYNRFNNIDQVLTIVYENMVKKIRESINIEINTDKDYVEQVIEIVANTVVMSYALKVNFNHYVFKSDLIPHRHFEWWQSEIKKIIEYGKKRGIVKDIDTDIMSYAVWCFVRGYTIDALGQKIPQEKAISDFKYSFKIFIAGMLN